MATTNLLQSQTQLATKISSAEQQASLTSMKEVLSSMFGKFYDKISEINEINPSQLFWLAVDKMVPVTPVFWCCLIYLNIASSSVMKPLDQCT